MNIFIEVDDDDVVGADTIMSIRQQFKDSRIPPNGGKMKLREKLWRNLSRMYVEYEMEIGCDKYFYGRECQKYCKEDSVRTCDEDGNMKCRYAEDKNCNMIG